MNEITEEVTARLVDLLREQCELPSERPVTTTLLGGGVSNIVLKIEWDSSCVIAKQPRANLDVQEDWPADTSRVQNEAMAARVFKDVLDTREFPTVFVPEIFHEDTDNHVILMNCAPESAKMWKDELLNGKIDVGVAATLGTVLAEVHSITGGDEELKEMFADARPFEQLRLTPYHRTTARRHPDVANYIHSELDRIREVHKVLVHGDYSPKNVLVDRKGSSVETWLIDFEVAHWGDPVFDVAFMLNHLFIKSVYHADAASSYFDAAIEFWESYERRIDWDDERYVMKELPILMLARVDGKSPVEYVTSEQTKNQLRTIAKCAVRRQTATITGFIDLVRASLTTT